MSTISREMPFWAFKAPAAFAVLLLIPVGIFIDIAVNGNDSVFLPRSSEVTITDTIEDAGGNKTVVYTCQDKEYRRPCSNDRCPEALWYDNDCSDARQSDPDKTTIEFAPFIAAGCGAVCLVAAFYAVTTYRGE